MTLRKTFQKPTRVLIILAALIVGTGLVIGLNTDELTMQTAIGQTNDTLQTSEEDFQYLERANRAFINLVKQTRPAVVQIRTQTKRIQRRMPRNFFDDDVYRFFFGPESDSRREPERDPEPMRSLGSGVIVREDGYILTNNHVIDGVDHITVTLANGREYPAKLVGSDPAQRERSGGGSDLALLKIDADNLPALQFGDSDALEVGEWVIAIGSPLGLTQTVTRGVVSAKGRNNSMVDYGDFIQTDTPINRGNSGGALINIRGELVGINTLIATGGYTMGNIGIGFAIPSNLAQQLMPSLIEDGRIVRGWLGISMNSVNHDLADELNFEEPRGVVIDQVVRDSPAEKAGIQPRDIILEFDGKTVRDTQHLMSIVAATKVGKPVKLTVLRKGSEEKQLTVKLEERTAETMARHQQEQEAFRQRPEESFVELRPFAGLYVRSLTPSIAERYGYPANETGVIVTQVADDSDAARQGIIPGFLIQEIEWKSVDNLDTYIELVTELKKQSKEKVLLYVKSPPSPVGRSGGYVTVRTSTSDR